MGYLPSKTDLDTTRGSASDSMETVDHASHHAIEDTLTEALQDKVGIDSSTDVDSLDYGLYNASSISPGHKHALNDNTDVDTTGVTDGQVFVYESASSKWKPADTDAPDASTTVKGVSKLATAPASATNPIAVGDNDPRVPTTDENDALVGTSGTPSSTNKYVTADQTAEAKTASKIPIRDANGDVLVTTTPTDGDAAGSKTYIDDNDEIFKAGQTTRDLSTASGDQTIAHGLGRTPKLIKITVIQASTTGAMDNYSFGTYDGSTNSNVRRGQNNNNQYYVGGDTTSCVSIYTAGSNDTTPSTAIATFDGTNITLAWTKATSASGTAYLLWEAIG